MNNAVLSVAQCRRLSNDRPVAEKDLYFFAITSLLCCCSLHVEMGFRHLNSQQGIKRGPSTLNNYPCQKEDLSLPKALPFVGIQAPLASTTIPLDMSNFKLIVIKNDFQSCIMLILLKLRQRLHIHTANVCCLHFLEPRCILVLVVPSINL